MTSASELFFRCSNLLAANTELSRLCRHAMLNEATAPLIKKLTSQVRYNELAGTLKLAADRANEPEEQSYRLRRQRLPHKLADFTFGLCR